MLQPPIIPRSKWQPATFAERGVTVPFTTPSVAMARLRPADSRATELIIANPSGASGYYVLPLRCVGDYTSLSMHDRLLVDLLLELPDVTPSAMRRAAREAASSGAAGRAAAKAAKSAVAREVQENMLTNLLLITRLLRQAGFADVEWRHLDLGKREVRAMTRHYLSRYEQDLAMKPEAMLTMVEELAPLVSPIGVAGEAFKPAHDLTIERLNELVSSLRQWVRGEALDQAKGIELIARCADFTIEKARASMAQAHVRTDVVVALLNAWRCGDKTLLRDLSRPDWLFDGWAEISALWEAVTNDGREAQRATLARIETLVPVLPREAFGDAGMEILPHRELIQRRWVRLNEDWRARSVSLDDGARFEKAKGLAA